MSNDIGMITEKLDSNASEIRGSFGHLSAEQLNWKPTADAWSIGQCIDHLIRTSEIYSEDFQAVADGTRKPRLWERTSPLSGFFGRFLTKYMSKDEKKVKTTERFVPPSDISADVVEEFAGSQAQLRSTIESTANVDWDKTVLTSSFQGFVTYSLADAYKIIAEHQRRHIRQAKRVLEDPAFPE
jgi:hypothetical protein